MNVLLVANAYHPIVGGVEKAVAQFARSLGKLDCRVEVVTARNPISLPAFEVVDGVPVHRFPFYVYRDSLKSAAATLIGMPWACASLLRLAIRRKPCVVHVHFIYHNAVCVELVRKWLQKERIPVVVTFHGGDAPDIPASYVQTHPSESKILNWCAKRLVDSADAFTSVSQDVRQTIFKSVLHDGVEIHVIHNGVDPELFSPLAGLKEEKAILAIGRLSHQKGFDILVQAFWRIAGEHPDWSLRIAGDGELRASLERLAGLLGLREHVRFLGMLSTEQLIPEINSAAFVVSPSRSEGFSLSALEAQACGKALITTDVEGAREMVTDGVNGLIVPKEQPEALARAMKYLIREAEVRRRMGRQARELVTANFTWDKAAQEYKVLYEDVLRTYSSPHIQSAN